MKKTRTYNIKLLGFFIVVVATNSCTKEKAQPVSPDVTAISCDTIETVSFSQHIMPLFNQHCNTAGCHGGSSPRGNLNLEGSVAYTQLTTKGYIDTLKPNFSILYAEMMSTVRPMPPSGKLDTCKTNLVLKWIQQKAKNN